ncbi:MAG: hypothetical protein ABQ298_00865 [Puniceicoccaceae bacterium]
MRFLFIIPCFESGKDGVGDYTRRLIGAVESLPPASHECRVVGWNDTWVSDFTQSCTVLRLPSSWNEARKVKCFNTWLADWQPDAVSLQWVPFGYHARGLFVRQIASFSRALAPWPLQIMVHETWVGAKKGSTRKEQLLGWLQRRWFRQLVHRLQPRCVHTQAKAYQYLLAQQGIPSELLPLFGNIDPVTDVPPRPITQLRCGCFGALHPEFDIEPLIEPLRKLADELGRELVLLHAGRMGADACSRWQFWQERWKGRVQFQALGEQSEAEISRYLFSLDFGISSNPLSLVDKSGSIAAMLDHGLPVINIRDDVRFEGFFPETDRTMMLHRPTIETLRAALQRSHAPVELNSLEWIARRFVEVFASGNA